jgi:dCMP deaminase
MRPTRPEWLFDIATLTATRSTCNRLAVGALIVREGRVQGMGYNGPPAGFPHCEHESWEGPCKLAIHAEKNAIDFAARYGHSTDGCELFVTHAPCHECAKDIIQAGIIHVHFLQEFRDMHGVDLLNLAGVAVTHYG